ncbi:MAG: hypothetical protein H6657_14700 [Ardenticatenaceae bacterium]|nr:hypothetical protein [Ardenticatenaceae bacterium]
MAKVTFEQLWNNLSPKDKYYVALAFRADPEYKSFQDNFVERWRDIPIKDQYFVWSSLTYKEQKKLLLALSFNEQKQILQDLAAHERGPVMVLLDEDELYSIFDLMTTKEQAELLHFTAEKERDEILNKLSPSEQVDIVNYQNELMSRGEDEFEEDISTIPTSQSVFPPLSLPMYKPKLSFWEELKLAFVQTAIDVIKELGIEDDIPANMKNKLYGLSPNLGMHFLSSLDQTSRNQIFNSMDPNITKSWLRTAPPGLRNNIISNMPPNIRNNFNDLGHQ